MSPALKVFHDEMTWSSTFTYSLISSSVFDIIGQYRASNSQMHSSRGLTTVVMYQRDADNGVYRVQAKHLLT